jgi:hypothetical protein
MLKRTIESAHFSKGRLDNIEHAVGLRVAPYRSFYMSLKRMSEFVPRKGKTRR